jgi:hypothetical protein
LHEKNTHGAIFQKIAPKNGPKGDFLKIGQNFGRFFGRFWPYLKNGPTDLIVL